MLRHESLYEPFTCTFRRDEDSAYIRRSVKLQCLKIGFNSNSIDSILLMLTEILTNVSKHTYGYAEIHVTPLKEYERIVGIEIKVKDKGPGIEDLDKALMDGFSTAGSLGLGLGAIARLSDSYDIESFPKSKFHDSGTIIRFRKLLKSRPYQSYTQFQKKSTLTGNYAQVKHWNIDGYTDRKEGSRYNGDGIYWKETDTSMFVAIMDGVGHGIQANQATTLAIDYLKGKENLPLVTIMTDLHKLLKDTVGCQIGLIKVDKANSKGEYLIVGNIRAFYATKDSIRSLLSKDGTVGRTLPTISTQQIVFSVTTCLVFHSDGISRAWVSELKGVKTLQSLNLQINNQILRRYQKKNDDSSYIIIRSN